MSEKIESLFKLEKFGRIIENEDGSLSLIDFEISVKTESKETIPKEILQLALLDCCIAKLNDYRNYCMKEVESRYDIETVKVRVTKEITDTRH